MLPQSRTRQPTTPSRVDPSNYFGARVVSAVCMINGQLREIGPYGSGRPFTKAGAGLTTQYRGGVGPITTPGGYQAAAYNSTSDVYTYDYVREIVPSTQPELSLLVLAYADVTTTTDKNPITWGGGARTCGVSFGDGGTAETRVIFLHPAAGGSYHRVGSWNAGQVYAIGGSKVLGSATPPTMVRDGIVQTGGATINAVTDWQSAVTNVRVGLRHGASVNGEGGLILGVLFNKAWTVEEHAELQRNPWQLVAPLKAVLYSFPSASTPTISSTNNSNTLVDESSFVITGTNLTSATAVTFEQDDRPDFDATAFITANDATSITLTGLDVQDMSMAYGAARVNVTTAGGTSADFAITIAPQATHTHITLASTDAGVEWLGLASADGDQRVAATTTTLGGTFAFVGTDGNYTITYPGDAPTDDSIYMAEFDDSADQWYESTVDINPSSSDDEFLFRRHRYLAFQRVGRFSR